MKKITFLALTLISLSCFSCPDLAGKYNCSEFDDQGGSDTFTLEITQSDKTFDISLNGEESEMIIADGVTRIYDTIVDSKLTTYCSEEKVFLNMVADISVINFEVTMLSTTVVSIENGVLTQKTLTSADGDIMNTTATCYPY